MTHAWLTVIVILSVGFAAAAQDIHPERQYPPFSIGVSGVVVTIEPGRVVTVQETIADTKGSELLRAGDVITSANGRSVDVDDPRVPLGEAIGDAERRGGRLVLEIDRDGRPQRITVEVPVLGAYAARWPANCRKSEKIIESTAAYIVAAQHEDGAYAFGDARPERDGLTGCLAGLFLLSTGDDAYLPNVRRQVHAITAKVVERPTTSTWHLGYQGILLGEYYLRTGDASVLPGLKSLCDRAIATQAAGGWGHGGVPNPGYVQSGLMNSAGVTVLTALLLARECGVDVDEAGVAEALLFFYRMAGHGCVCYGDHRSELMWPNTNGRNAKLACALALLDEPRFQRAAEHLASIVADSYYKPEFGHTGGGFNVMWRGMGSIHIPREFRDRYHRQMEQLAWYYDLARQPGGGFSMLATPPDNTRYMGLVWGTGSIGLTYTAPLRTLRITGAPRTRHSVDVGVPEIEWGTDADLEFFRCDNAQGFGSETSPPHEVYDLLIGARKKDATVEFAAKHLRHYSPMVRTWAARWLNENNSSEAARALMWASRHDDPRVRRAAYDGVCGYDNWSRPMRSRMPRAVVSADILPAIEKTLDDPDAAWWEIDGALFALGRAEPSDIRAHEADISRFAAHEEWYLRESAFWALDGLRESLETEEIGTLATRYAAESRVFARTSFDAGFKDVVRSRPVPLEPEQLALAARELGPTLHSALVTEGYDPESARHEAAHRTMMLLKHFDPAIYRYLVDDFVTYLESWQPYFQHSVWLITGSRWQPGIIKVMDGLGADGRPIHERLVQILERYEQFDPARIDRNARETLEGQIRDAVTAWEAAHGAG